MAHILSSNFPDGPDGPHAAFDVGGVLTGAASPANSVLFQNNGSDTGSLVLGESRLFQGTVAGFYSDGTNSDAFDLQDIKFGSGVSWSFKESTNGQQGVLTVKDG